LSRKECLVNMLSVVGVFVPYFVFVFQNPMAFIGLMVVAVIFLVALLVGFHIVNAIITASIRKRGDVPPQDELDKLIELRAAKISGMMLSVIVVGWCLMAAFGVLPLSVYSIVNTGGV